MEKHILVEDDQALIENEINPVNFKTLDTDKLTSINDKKIETHDEFNELLKKLEESKSLKITSCSTISSKTVSINSLYDCIEQLSELATDTSVHNNLDWSQDSRLIIQAVARLKTILNERVNQLLDKKLIIYPLPKPENDDTSFFSKASLKHTSVDLFKEYKKDRLPNTLAKYLTNREKTEKNLETLREKFITLWLETRESSPIISKLLDVFLDSSDAYIFVYANANSLLHPHYQTPMGGMFVYHTNIFQIPYKSLKPLKETLRHEGIHAGLRNFFEATNGAKLPFSVLEQYPDEHPGSPFKPGDRATRKKVLTAIEKGNERIKKFAEEMQNDIKATKIIERIEEKSGKYAKFSEALSKIEAYKTFTLTFKQAETILNSKEMKFNTGVQMHKNFLQKLGIDCGSIPLEIRFESLAKSANEPYKYDLSITFNIDDFPLIERINYFLDLHKRLLDDVKNGYAENQYISEFFGYTYSELPLEILDIFYPELNSYLKSVLNLQKTVALHYFSENSEKVEALNRKEKLDNNQNNLSSSRHLLGFEDESLSTTKIFNPLPKEKNNLIDNSEKQNLLKSQNSSSFFTNTTNKLLASGAISTPALLATTSSVAEQNNKQHEDLGLNTWLIGILASSSLLVVILLLIYINKLCKKTDSYQEESVPKPKLK